MTAKKKTALPESNENWKVVDPKEGEKEISKVLGKKKPAKKSGQKRPAKSPNRAQKAAGTVKPTDKKNKKKQIKKTEGPTKKLGRPPVPYDPERHPEWVRGLASRGSSIPEICTAMGVSRGTLYAWRDTYPDFLAAMQVGKNETIARLHNSLMKKAIGFSIPTERVEESDTYRKVITGEEYFPPDVRAATILLVNLDPKFKTDRTQNELTGPEGGPLESTIILIPDNGRDKTIAATAKGH